MSHLAFYRSTVMLLFVELIGEYYLQVDLEPQGKLHLKVDLKWNSQG